MAEPNVGSGEPITDPRQLAEYLAAGAKPAAAHRIGTEHEKFVFRTADGRRAGYEGQAGIRALLEGIAADHGWTPVLEAGLPIALERDGVSISLEPGGQFELSGATLETLHETAAETALHLHEVRSVADRLGLRMLAQGFDPHSARADVPWMPKGRYAIMGRYMPTQGGLGLDMMLRTCTVQVNLDFTDEADMVRKLRVSLALQPVATALFANSPFTDGRPNGFRSFRAQVWTDTDPDRTGDLPFAFEPGMGFERYAAWVLEAPMYFVRRDGRYLDAAGQSFRDFMAGRLPALPGERPTAGDLADHLTTVFPDVRLKRYLEMRGADAGPKAALDALPALWVGLLYDPETLAAAAALTADWTLAERTELRRDVPRLGLLAPFRGADLRPVAFQVVALARAGLVRRARLDAQGRDEAMHLDWLLGVAERGRAPADDSLDAYRGRWAGDLAGLDAEQAYW